MARRSSRWIFFVVATLCCLQLQAQAEPEAAKANGLASASTAQRDGLVVSLRMSRENYIPRQLEGVLEIRNTGASRKVSLSSLSVVPSGRLGGIYGEAILHQKENAELVIEPQAAREFRVTFKVARHPTLFEHATFQSGPNEFVVRLQYFSDELDERQKRELSVSPELGTSNIYVVVGGCFGALLLIAFMVASKALALARANQLTPLMARFRPLAEKWLFLTLVYAINGLVIALLLVLLSAGLNVLTLPIAFKLQDFTGGLIVGLFSVSLGKFLSEKLSLL